MYIDTTFVNHYKALMICCDVPTKREQINFHINLNCFDMYALKIACYALIFIFS